VAQVFVADLGAPEVTPDDLHHLKRVLRLRRGETVIACDGTGGWRTCLYTDSTDPSRLIEAEGEICHAGAPADPVVVGFTPVKGERPEWIVQKLTEVGVDRIAIVRSTRAVVHWGEEREERAVERLRRVMRQAAAQSRRAWLAELIGVVSLAELRSLVAPDALALAEPGADPPTSTLTAVAVGPEGGWEPGELDRADMRVGLGSGILRAETAAVTAGFLLCALRDGLVVPVDASRSGSAP
jgi:16S rRNA (uracil1498-N3)-methyltransferase